MIVKVKNKLKEVAINYGYLLGDWLKLFDKDFLNSFYMNNLMSFLYISYNENKYEMCPNQLDVFKSFTTCRYANVKVILMTEFPSATNKGNGVGLGNNDTVSREFMVTPQLTQLKKCVEDTCHLGLNMNFNNSLEHWNKQGVMCINSALSCFKNEPAAHATYWEKFMRQFIINLSDNNEGLIFAFVGEACKYAKYVNTDFHKVVEEEESIEVACEYNSIWMSDMFNTINDEYYALTGNMIDW
jgi:uracil DNA glycosylase